MNVETKNLVVKRNRKKLKTQSHPYIISSFEVILLNSSPYKFLILE